MGNLEGCPASMDGMREAESLADAVIVVRGAISPSVRASAFEALSGIEKELPPSLTRRAAAGYLDLTKIKERFPLAVGLEPLGPTSGRVVMADGRVLRQVVSNPVQSYMAGWRWDRFKAKPAPGIATKRCGGRVDGIAEALQAASAAYKYALPDAWAEQSRRARFPIYRTPFTSLAINVDYESCYHRDAGDLVGCWSTVSVLGDESHAGGELCFPELGAFVRLKPGDVALFKAHRLLHGNAPVSGGPRISVVAYARRQLCE